MEINEEVWPFNTGGGVGLFETVLVCPLSLHFLQSLSLATQGHKISSQASHWLVRQNYDRDQHYTGSFK